MAEVQILDVWLKNYKWSITSRDVQLLPSVNLYFALLAVELKAKPEAETRAVNLAAVELASAKKVKTITCIEGKLTKKVTSIKPVCPSGFKKK